MKHGKGIVWQWMGKPRPQHLSSSDIPEPTADDCSEHNKVFEDDHKVGYAIWYPQMGGYIAKAVALFDKFWWEDSAGCREGGCINVLVWHDGEFPFGDAEAAPRRLHHCDPEQFVQFGTTLAQLNERHRMPENK